MTDYTELIHDLLYCADRDRPDCSICGYESTDKCKDRIKLDAAAAIEELQAEVDNLKRTDAKRCQECLYLGQPVGEEQLPKRGEWELIDEAESMRWGCSRCKYLSWEISSYCPRCGAKMEVQE